ncbi:formylglycine-generating enzyme family protein [Lignipirellula cremea]|uniref:Serine/threonine-protein kinase pkn1 n=1 Tax=Lignipirellula cremea TaxID=2528010 RepID=A0A518DKZ7_9BACT|nr:SUMF1/EgtB/PvdO family nonheme iron enzyme [Lignipirellula cremea]QDU92513.1 Serine/threonine-protein kinase pkn1 [Lignipirellula cremea]
MSIHQPACGKRFPLFPAGICLALLISLAPASAAEPVWKGWSPEAPAPAVFPFDAAQARTHQQAWAEYLQVPATQNVALPGGEKIQLQLIPPGEFRMYQTYKEPEISVLTHAFWMSETEVTQAQWQAVMGEQVLPDKRLFAQIKVGPQYPVTFLLVEDVVKFCDKLTQQIKAAGKLPDGYQFDLPTSAQWEFACRSGSNTPYYYGEDAAQMPDYAWFFDNAGDPQAEHRNFQSPHAHAVGLKKPNAWGLFDMYGNLMEPCQDENGFNPGGIDPLKRQGDGPRIVRGGNFITTFEKMSLRYHPDLWRGAATKFHGLRLVLSRPLIPSSDRPPQVASLPAPARPLPPTPEPNKPETPRPEPVWTGWPADAPPAAVFPFDADQAKVHQQDWAEYAQQPIVKVIPLGNDEQITMILIPPGKFTLAPDVRLRRQAEITAVITQPFWIAETEVTQGQWEAVMGPQKLSERDAASIRHGPNYPASCIPSDDLVAFYQKLAEKVRTLDLLPPGYEMDFPTAAQWEFACRAGTNTAWYFGDDPQLLPEHAWFGELAANPEDLHMTFGRPHAQKVKLKKPNPWGLYDLLGNLAEACKDNEDYPFAGGIDPFNFNTGKRRICSGASFNDPLEKFRLGYHELYPGRNGSTICGLRPVMTLPVLYRRPPAEPPLEIPELVVKHPDGGRSWPESAPPRASMPCDAQQARRLQEAWAAYLQQPVEKTVALPRNESLTLRLIPPGDFMMGAAPESFQARIADQYPQHQVWITRPFYLGKFEITRLQWNSVMVHRSEARLNGDYLPQSGLTMSQVEDFLAALNQHAAGQGVRFVLPTEAQWEYACRAGSADPWSSGGAEDDLLSVCWYRSSMIPGRPAQAQAVGQLNANAFGLHDMHGNLGEWCADLYARDAYQKASANDPTGPSSGLDYVVRGGMHQEPALLVRSAARAHGSPVEASTRIGVRVALIFLDE